MKLSTSEKQRDQRDQLKLQISANNQCEQFSGDQPKCKKSTVVGSKYNMRCILNDFLLCYEQK